MDQIVEQVCREAAQKLSSRVMKIEDELDKSRKLNIELEAELRILREASKAHQSEMSELRTVNDELLSRIRAFQREEHDQESTQSKAIASTVDHSAEPDVRIEDQNLPSLHPTGTALQDNVQDTHIHIMSVKYEKLKGCYKTMRDNYKKERAIWKKWIAYIQRHEISLGASDLAETNPLVPAAPSANTLSALSPNISKQTIKAVPSALDQEKMQTVAQRAEARLHPKSATSHHVKRDTSGSPLLLSSQDTYSVDLDEITARKPLMRVKQQAREQRGLLLHSSPIKPIVLASSRDLRRIRAFAEDEATQMENHIPTSGETFPLIDILATPASNIPGQRVSPVLQRGFAQGGTADTKPLRGLKRSRSEAEQSPNIKRSTPVNAMSENNRGRGRYSSGLAKDKSLSMSDYIINPHDRIAQQHADNEVVRGESRKALHASDCACCSTFYKLAGPAHNPPQLTWASPPQDHEIKQATNKQLVGRHRSAWRRSPTPPGFWDCDFPTTQELKSEKTENEQRRSRILSELERSAASGGRYIRKSVTTID